VKEEIKERKEMKSRTRHLNTVVAALLLAAWMAPNAQAQDAEMKAQMEADKTGTNPMNFTFDARLYNETQWLTTPGGARNISTLEFRAPFADGKWQFRGKVRGVGLNNNLGGTRDVDTYGMGDTDLRLMTIPYMKNFAVATGVEFFLDTASQDPLGSGADSIAPFVFVGIFNPIGKGSILVPGYQHIMSFNENTGVNQVSQGLIDMFLVKTWNENQFWGYIDPQILLDYENKREYMLLELQLGMMTDKYFNTKGHSAWIMPSLGVGTDRPYDISLEAGYKVVW
jgi:hypothetical protein